MSRLSLAHTALEKNSKNGKIKLGKAKNILLSSPGFTLEIGHTVDDLLKELEKWEFIQIQGNNIQVKKW